MIKNTGGEGVGKKSPAKNSAISQQKICNGKSRVNGDLYLRAQCRRIQVHGFSSRLDWRNFNPVCD